MSDTSLQIESQSPALPAPGELRDYIALLKPRVMSLVVFTAFAGMLAAPGSLHPVLGAVAILCIAVSAGAAGAINMWYERDIDAIMARTAQRPLPQGKVAPAEALTFGVALSILSTMMMGLAVNWVAAAILALANLFYVFVYTIWLKRRTPQNIVIGGAAGAFPPMIGWAAVTGDVGLESIALFLLIFLWTPPHFWALALFAKSDYAQAGVPMLPVVSGIKTTKRQILYYCIALLPVSLLPTLLGTAGWAYGAVAGLMSLGFIGLSLRILREEGNAAAKQTFGYSILYLFVLFALLMVDSAASNLLNW